MRMIVHGMHSVAGDVNCLRGFGNSPEMLRRQRSGPLQMLLRGRLRNGNGIKRRDVEWCRYVDRRYLRTMRFRQSNAMRDGLLG